MLAKAVSYATALAGAALLAGCQTLQAPRLADVEAAERARFQA